MKKALAILSALALVGGAAFAADPSISWGAWGRGVFVPVQSSDGGTTTTSVSEASWSGNPRIGFGIHGKADKVGFDVDLTGDIEKVGIGDNAKIWVKPVDQVKLSLGKVQGDTLRGKIGDSSFARYVGSCGGEDNIFQRFYPGNGLLVDITPVDGLYIGAAVDPSSTATKAEDVFKKVQIGAGYTIANVGLVRAQFIGGTGKITKTAAVAKGAITGYTFDTTTGLAKAVTATSDTAASLSAGASRAEVAFALTAVQGLTLDIGAKVPLAVTESTDGVDYSVQDSYAVSVGANYGKDALGVFARVDATVGGIAKATYSGTTVYEKKASTVVNFYAVPSYKLDFATVGCDLALGATIPSSGDTVVAYGAAPYVEQGLGNGKIKAGFAVKGSNEKDSKIGFAVPVLFEYWF